MEVTQAVISKLLNEARYIQKQRTWVTYELKPRDVKRQICKSEMLLEGYKKYKYLHRIVTGLILQHWLKTIGKTAGEKFGLTCLIVQRLPRF